MVGGGGAVGVGDGGLVGDADAGSVGVGDGGGKREKASRPSASAGGGVGVPTAASCAQVEQLDPPPLRVAWVALGTV